MTKPEGAGLPANPEKPPAVDKEKPAAAKRPAAAKAKKPKQRQVVAAANAHTGHAWMWVALVAMALAGGGSIASLWFLEDAARKAQTQQLEAAIATASPDQVAKREESAIAALDSRVTEMEKRVSAMPDLTSAKEAEAATGLLSEKIEGLSGRIAEVEKNLSKVQGAATSGRGESGPDDAQARVKENSAAIDSLKERIEALEQAKQASASTETVQRNQALVVAVGQLREALAGSKPFAAELSAVTALGNSDVSKIADRLTPYAAGGIATVADLRDEFPRVADAVVQAGGESKSPDWVTRALAQASNVVTVRRIGPVEGTTPGAIVSRAEARLANDDIDGALAEMAALTGPAADAGKNWVTKAQARVAAEQTLKDLHLQVIGQIAQRDGSTK